MPQGPRPRAFEERLAQRLFLALAPRPRQRHFRPPAGLGPATALTISRGNGAGQRAVGELSATWYEARGEARGAVLLVHPWRMRGQAWFHRCGRIPGLVEAGYGVLTVDLGGFGGSGPPPRGFYDHDLADAWAELERRAPGLPLHLWGLSAGGYWAHLFLSRRPGVRGAVFEDVPRHLIEWSKRLKPRGWPFYMVFQHALRRAYRFFDLAGHAAALDVEAAYVGGGGDREALASETRQLARLAGARCLVVPGARHLEAFKCAGEDVLALAIETFHRAEGRR